MFSVIEASIAPLRVYPRVVFSHRRPRVAVHFRKSRHLTVQSTRGPSYEDLARRHAREQAREERPLKPLPVQLAEAIEGICLLAAVTLKLVPVCYSVYLQRRGWRPQIRQTEDTATISEETTVLSTTDAMAPSVASSETAAVEQGMTEMMPQLLPLSHLSEWSGVSLLIAVVIGSLLRRFQIQPSDTSVLMEWTEGEREEMESSLGRAFAEIAHMASQIENLRTKVRSMRREYTSAFETADVQSDRWRRSVEEIVTKIDGTEAKVREFNEVMEKMQGFATKQFVVVSTALRRIDKECKTLTAQLASIQKTTEPSIDPVTAESSIDHSEMTRERTEIDYQS